MRCPECGIDDDKVVDSRPTPDGASIRRRRECRACGTRFTTFERVELPDLWVLKRSGVRMPFSRQKVLDGMAGAAKGRVSQEELERAAARVEQSLRAGGTREVTSEQVGLKVLAQLHDLDDVSYVRFASVYKDFQGPEDFEEALLTLRKEAPPKANTA
ncbi:MAG TPA: transcriptional regulator NrdR [Egicoccus sp.]|nr:transcriptional regulator NrdR [Egicoccus sp.]HSK24952.1 transcriptional regulator NrdR [Egicoccus sp.]